MKRTGKRKKMTKSSDSYLTIKKEVRKRLNAGRCRFIASVSPAADEEEARRFIELIRTEFPDATHHVYAYRTGFGRKMLERCSDDREPAGTAGPPVLGVIRKMGLTGLVVVVTRYFGGVKLGTGGLIRAYRNAAEEGLKGVWVIRKVCLERMRARIPYECLGIITKLISSRKGEIISIDYDSDVTVDFLLRSGAKGAFKQDLYDRTRGRGVCTEVR